MTVRCVYLYSSHLRDDFFVVFFVFAERRARIAVPSDSRLEGFVISNDEYCKRVSSFITDATDTLQRPLYRTENCTRQEAPPEDKYLSLTT